MHVGWFNVFVSLVMSHVLFVGLRHTCSVGLLCREELPLGQGRVSTLKHLVLLGWVVLDRAAWELGTVQLVTGLAGATGYAVQCTDQDKAIETKGFLTFVWNCSR